MSEAAEKLKKALPHLLCGFQEAKQTGKAVIVIASQNLDGGGQMLLTLDEPEEFLRDVCEVAGIPFEPTKEDLNEYQAYKFMSRFGKAA